MNNVTYLITIMKYFLFVFILLWLSKYTEIYVSRGFTRVQPRLVDIYDYYFPVPTLDRVILYPISLLDNKYIFLMSVRINEIGLTVLD